MQSQNAASMEGVTPDPSPTSTLNPTGTSGDLNSVITDALKQQASQFEAIIGSLQTQISDLGLKKTSTSTKAKSASKSRPSVGSDRYSTPPAARRAPRVSTSGATPKTRKTSKASKTPTPVRKRHPLQLKLSDLPKEFRSTKEALFVHIKMMWGLFRPNDVPPPPDAVLLKEFYDRFNNPEEVEAVMADPASSDLVAMDSILTLRDTRIGKGQLGRGLVNLDQMYILYIHGILAKVGIRAWAPDLNDTPDSLYNSACRITALNTFRQLLAGGAYAYMNVKLKYANSMSLMIAAYNHYVHYLMAAKFKTETKEAGRIQKQNNKKKVQKNRERLRDARVEFLLRNRSKYPARYRKVVEDVNAHSDDELDPEKNVYIIKTLPYRSKNANKFFRRLDVEMLKEAQISQAVVRRRVRRLARTPRPSLFKNAPLNMPIDYYDPEWFNSITPCQKRLVANADMVAFLPDASESLMPPPHRHPDEELGDTNFTVKYLEILSEPYGLLEGDDDDFEDDDEDEEEEDDDAIELDQPVQQDESDDDLFDEGEYGDLYDDKADDSSEDEE